MQSATQISHEQKNSMSWGQFIGSVLFDSFSELDSLINIFFTFMPIKIYTDDLNQIKNKLPLL